MKAFGHIPDQLSTMQLLNSIGDNILIADKSYAIQWMNVNAAKLLTAIAPLYGLSSAEEMIGLKMDFFHNNPKHQERVMRSFQESHRARITIKNLFVTDIVITPILNAENMTEGYIVMLTDVTTKAEEEKQKEKLLNALSVPIIHIWKKTISLPLIGEFDTERADRMISSVLQECAQHQIQYVLTDLSGLYNVDKAMHHYIQKFTDCLRLIGAECIIVGVTPKLAMLIGELEKHTLTFQTARAGLEYIIRQNQIK